MKNILSILLLIPTLVFVYPLKASNASRTENMTFQAALRSQILALIEVPEFIHENNSRNDYKAVVCIRPDGRIVPESSLCSNAELKTYVEEELGRIRLKQNVPQEDTRIFLIIRFKVF